MIRALPPNTPDWILRHRAAWAAKPALKGWYEVEIFSRLDARLAPGRTLQLGCGPGFYGRDRSDFLNVDLTAHDGVDVACDVHALPFPNGAFQNVVAIDVLHHLARPGEALAQIARVLAPTGKCLLVEPWADLLGWLVYRFLHHEDCRAVADPWRQAFAPNKSPMDGNAWIPRALLWRRSSELGTHVPGFAVAEVEPFGSFSYLATGGFGKRGLSASAVESLAKFETALPEQMRRALALRALFVLSRSDSPNRGTSDA